MPRVLTLLLLTILVSSGAARPQVVAVDQNQRFTGEQLSEDLDFFLKTIGEAHFDPYTVTPEVEMRRRVEAVRAEVRRRGGAEGMTQKEFWLLFLPLVSAIGDSHTYVADPRFFVKAGEDTTRYFPVRTEYVDGQIVVVRSIADEPVKPGAVITSINGTAAKEIVSRLSEYSFGTTRERAMRATQWLWVGAAEVLFRRPDEFVVTFADGRTIRTKGLLLPEYIRRLESGSSSSAAEEPPPAPPAPSPLHLKFFDDNRVAYLYSRTFAYDLAKYRQLLADVFGQIKKAGSKTLIIDVRGNSGGNSALGNALIDMFNARAYRGYSMKWKRSDQYVAEMNRRKTALPDNYLKLKPGEILTSESGTARPSDNPLRFAGKVYVLSSRYTFSSAQMFLALVKDNKLATIIGEQTDAPVCNFGEIFFFNLPNSRLRMSLSVKQWTPPSGCKDPGRGVIPDIVVNRTVNNYLTDRDLILETALTHARATHNK